MTSSRRNTLHTQPLVLLQLALALTLALLPSTHAADTNSTNDSNSTRIDSASDTIESIFDSAQGIKLGGSIVAVLAIAAGAVICAAGYKLFRAALFVVGFVAGGVLLAIAVEHIFASESWVITASWVTFVVGGLFAGSLVVSLYTTSIFVAGAAAGVLLAVVVNTSVGYKLSPSDPTLSLVVLAVVLGLLGGVLALKLEKPVLVVATAFVGAGLAVWGVGYFAGDFPSASDLKRFATQDATTREWIYAIPDAWWGYVAGIGVLFVLGLCIQFRKTARGGDYHRSHALPARASRRKQQEQVYGNAQTPQESNAHYGNPISHV